MRIIAPMMILIMMTSTLAGCTGGDPDGGGEIDTDAVNDLIDQNLQDFINNTTITVNQEIHHHYYNNTTVNEGDMTNNDYTVEYNNTTVNEGDDNNLNEWTNSSYSFNGSGDMTSLLQVLTNTWDPSSHVVYYDLGNHIISLDGAMQQSNNNPNLLSMHVYNGTIIYFEDITCNQLRNYGQWNNNVWEDYLYYNFGWHDDIYEVAQDIEGDFHDLYDDEGANECGNWHESHSSITTSVEVFSIDLSIGQAIDFISVPHLSDIILDCDNGLTYSFSNNSVGSIMGGHSNCTVSGIAEVTSSYGQWTYSYPDNNGDNTTTNNLSQYGAPSWYGDFWRYFESAENSFYTPTPNNLVVYFDILFVEIYN